MKSDCCFYYDYAGVTFYLVKLNWFFNCPDDLLGLVAVCGQKIRWHMHVESHDENGFSNGWHGYFEHIEPRKELLDYFQNQRDWVRKLKQCKTREERQKINKLFSQ